MEFASSLAAEWRYAKMTGAMPGTEDRQRLISFATFQVDLGTGELLKQGRKVKLQGQPFALLALLLEHPGQIVTRDELKDRIWGSETVGDFDRGLNRAVNKIREALGDSAESPRYLETIPRRGYRFIGVIQPDRNVEAERMPASLPPDPVPAGSISGSRASTAYRWSSGRRSLILLLALVAFAAVWRFRQTLNPFAPGHQASQIHSIAVLPLENLSNDAGEEYFADGVTDQLITDLAKFRQLRVISRTSVMRFKKKRASLSEIAAALKVDAVVEGTVVRSNQKVRITAQLVQPGEERHLWAETYERKLTDVMDVQEEIATAIAKQIQLALQTESRGEQQRPVSAAAYDEYLRGRFFWERRTEKGAYEAIQHFNRATELEPDYAAAYAGIADAYFVLSLDRGVLPPAEGFPKGKAAALKALQIDPSNSEAHASLAWEKLFYEWDWAGAEKEANLAIYQNPNNATAHRNYSRYLALMGRFDESLKESRKTLELEPLGPFSGGNLAWNSYLARQYPEAVKQSQVMINMYPTMTGFYSFLGWAKEQQGQFAEAIGASRQSGDVVDLGYAYALSGNRAETTKIVDRLSKTASKTYVPATSFALLYLGLGQNDEGFKWLEKAYAERSPHLVYLKVDPKFDRLRADPRFAELLRRIGFPE
ncbi:MAG: winged helix-turn-helix domain-containing protein [Bryobacteraceae bacterium]